MSVSIVSSSRLRCSGATRSDWAANFSRLRTAISCVILSINACLNAISRSRPASVAFIDSTNSRSCCASRWARSRAASFTRNYLALERAAGPYAQAAIASQDADHSRLSDALPRQAKHERVELLACERQRVSTVVWPSELARVQSPGCQPDADTVVHQHLHPVCPAVGEEICMVRARGAEDVDHPSQRRLGAGSHIEWFGGQPDRIDPNHRSNSRIQAAQSAAAPVGQATLIVVAPRRTSIRMS